MARVARLGVVIDSSGAKKGGAEASSSIKLVDNAAKELQKQLLRAGSAAAAFGVALSSLRGAQSLEKAMALVGTAVDKSTVSLVVLERQLVDMFATLPVTTLDEMTKGLYDIVSSGIPAGKAIEFLGVSAKAAIAGVTSTAVAVDALTTVTNAFAGQGVSVEEAAEKMFAAVAKGKVTFEQLAGGIGGVSAIAVAYGVKLEDVLGATAQLTLGTLSAAEAFVGIRSAMVNIVRPTENFKKQFPELAKEFNGAKLEGVGFTQFLTEFAQKSGNSKDALNALFTDVQGRLAVFGLLTDGGVKATQMMRDVGASTTAMSGAFDDMAATSSALEQVLKNRLTTTMNDFGKRVLPIVNIAMRGLIFAVDAMRTLWPAFIGLVAGAAAAMTQYFLAARAAAAATAILGAIEVIKGIGLLAAGIQGLTKAMLFLKALTGGVAGAFAAIAGVAVAFIAYKAAMKAIDKDTEAYNKQLAEMIRLQTEAGTPKAPAPLQDTARAPISEERTEALKTAKELLAANEDRVRLARQAYDLAGLTEVKAGQLKRAQEEINAVIEVRRTLTGSQLDAAERAIALERQWADKAALVNERYEVRNKQIEAAKDNRARIDALKTEAESLQEQVVALTRGREEYARTVVLQAQQAAITERVSALKAVGLELSDAERGAIAQSVAEAARLLRVREALVSLNGKSPFDLSDVETNRAGEFADNVASTLSAAQGLVSAFGAVGRSIGAAIGQSAQLLTNLSRAQQSGRFTDAKGVQQNAGFLGALGGKAGAAGVAVAASSALGVAGAAIALADAVDLFGTRAKQRAQQLKEAAVAWNAALEDYGRGATTTLEEQLRTSMRTVNDLASQSGASKTFTNVAELDAFITGLRAVAASADKLSAGGLLTGAARQLQLVADTARVVEERLRAQNEAQLAVLGQDLAVRRLTAAGNTDAAAALRLRLDQERELADVQQKYGAAAQSYIDALREVQAAELAAAEAARELAKAEEARRQALTRAQFAGNVTARQQTLAGDDRGALITRATISNAGELAAAEELVRAGTITREMFDALALVLSGELSSAIQDFDKNAAAAAETLTRQNRNTLQDLLLRELIAIGDTEGAARARRRLDNDRELIGVTDAVIIAEIIRVQSLEEQAAALAAVAELERQTRAQNADITRGMIDAYRILNPAEAERLEAVQMEIVRADVLANAIDAVTRARYEELFRLQDQAKATQQLAAEQRKAADAARDLANLTADLDEQYLRESGREAEANVKRLERQRDEQLDAARKAGAAADTIQKIVDLFDLRFRNLIKNTIDNAQGPFGDAQNTEFAALTESVSRSISAREAIRLIDIASAQLDALRQIVNNTGGGGGGGTVTVDVNVTGAPGAASDLGASIGSALVPALDLALGRRVGIERRLTGNASL